MDTKLRKWKSRRDFLRLLQYRENNIEGSKLFKEHSQFTDSLLKRLGLEFELTGHTGCVNCLQWTPDGKHIASGSDDTHVILWDPFRHKQLHTIPTHHIGNIFSVKFLGYSTHDIATAAGDCRVIVQSIPAAIAKSPPILECNCHVNRVKRLATSPNEPTLFWSAAEDGLVIQYDLRERHECSLSQTKVLVDLSKYFGEVKCIAVNPTKPYYIAVGANDCYVRMYDRRMLKTCTLGQTYQMGELQKTSEREPLDPNCVQYYAPGHLAVENFDNHNLKLAATYISFNSAGTEMLVNMGGEQIYLFDINSSKHINEIQVPQMVNGFTRTKMPFYKCCCRSEGNGVVNYTIYNEPSDEYCVCFYMSRAHKCYTRKWIGDLYQAARDYSFVTKHWPEQKQAYIGLIRTLIALKWSKEAQQWLDYFISLNPDLINGLQIETLRNEITATCTDQSREEVEDMEPKYLYTRKVDACEQTKRLDSIDYDVRFVGHCNTTTDIKEANFLGEDGNYVCAGSDEGIIFIWERKRAEIVTALFGDFSIVNCVQPHPTACLIASSGIDPAVKLWSPMPEDFMNPRVVKDVRCVVEANQKRMALDPLMNINIAYSTPRFETTEAFHYPFCRTC